MVVAAPIGKLGAREVLFGGRVSWPSLAILFIVAGLIAFIGGWVGQKTAEHRAGVHHLQGDAGDR